MYDPEELVEMKKQAMDKVKLPPLSGKHSESPKTVSLSQLMSERDHWLFYLQNDERVRSSVGVRKERDGIWVLYDLESSATLAEPFKGWLREFLNEMKTQKKFRNDTGR